MFWEETSPKKKFVVPDVVVDVVFGMTCRTLPLDHAHALSSALLEALPWLADEPDAGIHLIHGAESGNGWYRPEPGEGEQVLFLSRRTRLELRVPRERVADVRVLSGQTLDIAGHALTVGEAQVRLLSTLTTLFSRYVVAGSPDQPEEDFLREAVDRMRALGVRCGKLLCGRSHALALPDGPLHTRSLMVADLSVEHSVRLQEKGLGPARKLGCGLFIPHKDIKAVRGGEDE